MKKKEECNNQQRGPIVSVIMSVYNADERYLREAIDSILNQTFTEYEFIIVNDGSSGKIQEILSSYKDSRIKLICNSENIGLTRSLNLAFQQACGKYLARMDADDISLPDRLQKQYDYMERHSQVGVLGCWTSWAGEVLKWYGASSTKWRQIGMLFDNCGICHPTAFFRASAFRKESTFYDEDVLKAQDYELWTRLLRHENIAVYPKVLLLYRWHSEQITMKNGAEQNMHRNRIRKKLLYELCENITSEEKMQFLSLQKKVLSSRELNFFFRKLIRANKTKKIYHATLLRYELMQRWWIYCKKFCIKNEGIKVLHNEMFWRMLSPGYLYYRLWRFWTINQFLLYRF